MIIYPFGCGSKNTAQDLFRSIALDMKKVIIDDSGRTNTYAVGTAPELLYQADGTDLDTHWQNFGTISYTFGVNARAQGFQPNHSVWKEKTTLGQEPGWKQLIKSVSKNAFKFVASEDFEYVIKTSEGESFAGKMGPTTFKARKEELILDRFFQVHILLRLFVMVRKPQPRQSKLLTEFLI